MPVERILSRLEPIGQTIRGYKISFSRSLGQARYYNLQDLARPVRHFVLLAKAIPDPRILEAAAQLDREVSAEDPDDIAAYHGDALAFVDTVEALGETPELLEQAYSVEVAGETEGSTIDAPSLQTTIREMEARIADMGGELKSLGNLLAEMKGSGSQTDDKLNPKERQSLQKMILGMAIEQYGYNPSARGSAVSQIADDLQAHGLSLDHDTIRKQLRVAAEELLERPVPN